MLFDLACSRTKCFFERARNFSNLILTREIEIGLQLGENDRCKLVKKVVSCSFNTKLARDLARLKRNDH
jgi:hypothetical protein